MANISCASCGMQYDGSGLQPGVQFQCTQCGTMVTVGAAAPAALGGRQPLKRRGGTGRIPLRGPAGRPPGAQGPVPYQGEAEGEYEAQPPGFGPPQQKSSVGLILAIVGGLAVAGLVILVIVLSGRPSPQEAKRTAAEARDKEFAKKRRKDNIEKKRVNETMTVLYANASAHGDKIANAIAAGNDEGLAALFDWDSFAMANREAAEMNKKLLNSPLLAQGDWMKREDGMYNGKYVGTVMRDAGGLRTRLINVFGMTIFGVSATYDKARSEHFESRLTKTIGGQVYYGRLIFVKSDACDKNLEFWVAGVIGQENVGVVYLAANSKLKSLLQNKEAPFQPPDRGQEDPYNRDPQNPNRDPSRDPTNNGGSGEDVIASIKVARTGETLDLGRALNVFRKLDGGTWITDAQVNVMLSEGVPRTDRKKFIGACIDKLIDAHAGSDRRAMAVFSGGLYKIFRKICLYGDQDDYVYKIDTRSEGAGSVMPLKFWLKVYQGYKA